MYNNFFKIKNKIIGIVIVAVVDVVAMLNIYMANNKLALSDLALENVEALANIEASSSITGKCNGSVVIVVECSVYCWKCGRTWYPSPRQPKSVAADVKGSCVCGNSS